MEFSVGMKVYFKGEKYEVREIFRPLGTYECYIISSHHDGSTRRAFRYELTSVNDIEEFMTASDDEELLSCLAEIPEPAAPVTFSRFAAPTELELTDLASKRIEPSTAKQTKWGVRVFKDWLIESHMDPDFEGLSCQDLNRLLRRFYAGARSKTGETYSKSALIGLRASINRVLNSPPYERIINFAKDAEFMTSNQIFVGLLKEQRRNGEDVTVHKEAISEGDLKSLYSTGTLSNANPVSLLRKVWFEVSLHLGRRGCEGLRSLTSHSFVFKTDDTGVEYVEMAYNESDKNHKGVDSRESDKHPRMYATQDDRCPIISLRKYLLKRNSECEAFFQRPLTHVPSDGKPWYANQAMGRKTLGKLMSQISADAKLSRRYTNHCVRATAATLLTNAGMSVMDVMSVTGHRNEGSVRSYATKPSVSKRREISHTLQSSSSSNQKCPSASLEISTAPADILSANDNCHLSSSTPSEYSNVNLQMRSQYSMMPQSLGGLFNSSTINNSTVTVNFSTSG